jgi:phage tail-like protein
MGATDSLIDGPVSISNTPTQSPAVSAGAGSSGGETDSVVSSYLFYVKIDGTVVGVFTDCAGIGAKRDASDAFFEGGVNDYKHILPGRLEYDHITLKRGVTVNRVLWDWFETGKFDFNVPRRSLTITQEAPGAGSSGGTGVVKTWSVLRAFPVSWKLADLNSGSSTMVIETLEIAHEGISLA